MAKVNGRWQKSTGLAPSSSTFAIDPSYNIQTPNHPGGNLGADLKSIYRRWTNLKSISHRCYLFEVAFVWELTKETVILPLGYLQGGLWDRNLSEEAVCPHEVVIKHLECCEPLMLTLLRTTPTGRLRVLQDPRNPGVT